MCGASNVADIFSSVKIWVPHYSNTANFTQAITQLTHPDNSITNGNWGIEADAVLFKETAAITEVSLHTGTGSFVEYSTFTLYGISD